MTLLTSCALLPECEPVAALTRFRKAIDCAVLTPSGCEYVWPHASGHDVRDAKLPGLVHLADSNGAACSQIVGCSPLPRMGLDLLASYTVEAQHGQKTIRHPRD
jgi:hypothetical protein